MKNAVCSLITAFLCASFVGCAHVNSVSLTSIPATKGRPVRAEASKTIFLGFNFDNDFVDEMTEDLKRQCPNGVIRGILTKDETIQYFLFFVWAKKISATGYCQQARNTASVDSEAALPQPAGKANGYNNAGGNVGKGTGGNSAEDFNGVQE